MTAPATAAGHRNSGSAGVPSSRSATRARGAVASPREQNARRRYVASIRRTAVSSAASCDA
jgi:hypothetical protein